MAQILCDCGCGETVTRPVFFNGACRIRILRSGNARVTLCNSSVTDCNARVTSEPEYEYSQNDYGKKIRRIPPHGDWEIQNPMTGKWVNANY